MCNNKVVLNILGTDYYLNTDESVEYAQKLGEELDTTLRAIRDGSSISVMQSAVLAALSYLDDLKKVKSENDALHDQLKNYHNIIMKNKNELDKLRKNENKNKKAD